VPADLVGSVSLSPESQVFVDPQHYSIHVLRIRTFRAYEFHVSSVFVAGRITARVVNRLRIAPHAARISVTHSRLFAQALKSIHLPHFLRRTLMSTHFAFCYCIACCLCACRFCAYSPSHHVADKTFHATLASVRCQSFIVPRADRRLV